MLVVSNQKITDDTSKLSEADLFLLTERNKEYFQQLADKPDFIRVPELIEKWGLGDIKFIGITGTNGKTTVATAVAYILNELGYLAADQGTNGCFINGEKVAKKNNTTPEVLETLYHAKLAKDAGAKYFVMEVSSHAIAQNRIEGLDFSLKIHTNITSDHLRFHKTIEEYRRVKNSWLADDSNKVINIDDEFVKFNSNNVTTYAWDRPEADFKIMESDLQTKLVGKFNFYNLTAAIVAVHKLLPEISLEEIKRVAADFPGVPGRMEVISTQPLIVVDFAHTPDGMEKVLTAFEEQQKSKKIAVVFGAGGDRDRNRRAPVGTIADQHAHKIYLTTDNPRSEQPEDIIQEILSGIKNKEKVQIILDRKEAIETAIRNLGPDDILLVLGKGSQAYQEVGNQKIPFDDREVIREFLKIKNGNGD